MGCIKKINNIFKTDKTARAFQATGWLFHFYFHVFYFSLHIKYKEYKQLFFLCQFDMERFSKDFGLEENLERD